MNKFRLKADTVIEAETLEDACFQLIEHLLDVANLEPWEVDVSAIPTPLEHTGSLSIEPEYI